ncbi:MAG: transcription antitermination protein NusB [Coprobacillus sp.]|nr:transcription antitermination protein NusB [Coprobacillus sp.]
MSNSNGLTRTKEHYAIMAVLYSILNHARTSGDLAFLDPHEVIVNSLSEDEITPFIENTVYESLAHYEEIVGMIIPHLHGWKYSRLPVLSEAILISSVAKYYFIEPKIQKAVVIDVAVSLAKDYVDDKQAKFINAILDEVLV